MASNIKNATPDASALFPVLRDRFQHYKGEEDAKRFRVNAARASNAARDVLQLLTRRYDSVPVPELERDFLNQVVRFFDELNGVFHNAELGAKHAKEKAAKAAKEKRAAEIKATKTLILGEQYDDANVLDMAADMQRFNSDAQAWLAKTHRGVQGGLLSNGIYDLSAAIKRNNVVEVANVLAEIRLEIGKTGSYWESHEGTRYSAGWEDFVGFRAAKP